MKKNNNFSEKNKIYLIIGGLLTAWVCFVVFIVSPSIKLLKNDFDSVQMKMINAQNNDSKLGKLNTLRSNYEKVSSEKDNLDVIFSKNNIVGLVKELEFIAQKTENEIIISVDEDNKKILEVNKTKSANNNEKENELLKSLPVENYFAIKISLVGNYNNLIKFVNKLNNIKYHNTIISFNIGSKEIVWENKDNEGANNGISAMNNDLSGGNLLSDEEKKKLVLNSELDVIFYSLEKNDGKK